jgi:protein-disulfide isomerase
MAQSQRKREAAGGKKGLQPFYIVLGLILVAGIAAIAWAASGGDAAATEPVAVDPTLLENPQALYAAAVPMTKGPTDAPVKLVVFSDYMCPWCGRFAAQIGPVLEERYIAPGTMQLVFYDFPLGGAHVHSFLAARAARCAGDQGASWQYHDILFGRLSEWSGSSSAPVGRLVGYARELGLDGGEFEECLRSDRFADVVTANRLLGEQLGVNSTPTVIVDNRRLPSAAVFDVNAIDEIVREAAGEVGPSAEPAGTGD